MDGKMAVALRLSLRLATSSTINPEAKMRAIELRKEIWPLRKISKDANPMRAAEKGCLARMEG